MQPEIVNKVSDKIINDIQPPKGWEVVDELDESVIKEPQYADMVRKRVAGHLPYIAHNVELFIDRTDKKYNIVIPEAYISIDADATFHIILLIREEDNHTPEFLAAKIFAEEMLTTIGDVSMRYTFTVAKEYFRFHYIENSFKLRYAYKTANVLLTTYNFHTAPYTYLRQ